MVALSQVRRRIAKHFIGFSVRKYKQDKENEQFSTGAYTAYVTEKKRKFDAVLRSIL